MPDSLLHKLNDNLWMIEQQKYMQVPAYIFTTEKLLMHLEEKAIQQIMNVASLPGIVSAAFAMPDAHSGYGFPIGGVAAFDEEEGGVVCAGGVGFDISCGVRTILTGLTAEELKTRIEEVVNALFANIPAGVGSKGKIKLSKKELLNLLREGARWCMDKGYAEQDDLERIEQGGVHQDAEPENISQKALERQAEEMGTLGSGNHYLEIQEIVEIFNHNIAAEFNLRQGECLVSIHCGSRGLGHQVATDYSAIMLSNAHKYGIKLADRELSCAPIKSKEGKAYLGAMRAAANCAIANRQILAHLVRETFRDIFGNISMPTLYDVSHNLCMEEEHILPNGKKKKLFVHRKGATRALPAGHTQLKPPFDKTGQPVLVGGSMGTASYILAGMEQVDKNSINPFFSACHGAGRCMSRAQAMKQWRGEDIVKKLELKNIFVRSPSMRGIAEEAPGAYKNIDDVINCTCNAALARRVAKVIPLAVVKG